VTFDEFIKQVQERGGFDTRDHAEGATRATLAVLGQRLAGGEPSDLAAQLPDGLAELARYDGPAESFDTAEFYRRVAEREGTGCTPGQAREHAMAVMSTVVDQITEGERQDLASQLPADYGELLR
jgi:uncharacterized protein (DUF2267 family)